jgi:NADPH-dependent 2,4-dienoyl-CoA reductase/sulfur reductase-like enzyme
MTDPVIIVGGSLGGLRTAESLRRCGYSGPIRVFGEETHAAYNRPPLSKEVLAANVHHASVAFPLGDTVADVEWIMGTRIEHVDLGRQVIVDERGGEHAYSGVVVATGLRSRHVDLPAMPTTGVHSVRTLDDALALREALTPGTRIIIYGAGFIGCEVAATARKMGVDVIVVGRGPLPLLHPLGPQLAADIQSRQEAHGVKFFMNSRITRVIGGDRVESVLLDNGVEIWCHAFVEAIGSEPNVELLNDNDVDLENGVRVDENLRITRADGTPWPNAFAVGDVARFPIPRFSDRNRRVEHWNMPTEMSRKVGKVLSAYLAGSVDLEAETTKAFDPIPSFWSDQFELSLLAYGLIDEADRVELLEGREDDDCVYGYFRGDDLVGVCGLGMRSAVMAYRSRVGRETTST